MNLTRNAQLTTLDEFLLMTEQLSAKFIWSIRMARFLLSRKLSLRRVRLLPDRKIGTLEGLPPSLSAT